LRPFFIQKYRKAKVEKFFLQEEKQGKFCKSKLHVQNAKFLKVMYQHTLYGLQEHAVQ